MALNHDTFKHKTYKLHIFFKEVSFKLENNKKAFNKFLIRILIPFLNCHLKKLLIIAFSTTFFFLIHKI